MTAFAPPCRQRGAAARWVLYGMLRRVRSDVTIPLPGGGTLAGVLALPPETSESGRPGVIVLHEIFGPQPEILEVADRFADRGYGTLAPDLFSAGTRLGCLMRAMLESSRGRPGRTTAAVEASRAWLAARPEIDADRLAIIGFCMGGGFALTYAAGAPAGLRAAAVNYGQVPAEAEQLRKVCPVVGSYGGRDRVMGREGGRLREHLGQLGIEHDVKTYPDAGHSFMTDGHHPIGRLVFLPMHIGHEPRAAEDAWARVFAFFEQHIEPAGVRG
jgi:carboxymethylenebutenolidase